MIVAPLLFVVVLEAGLRLGGYGYATSFFIGPDADGKYRTNPEFGWRFFPRTLARSPVPSLIAAKPAGTVRVFVLGSSAAQGVPNISFSFGRILEVMLRDRYPGVKFEVVNAAMTAVNSHVALQIAKNCAAHQPDLFVVYMGNNEVVGPYGPGTVFQHWSPSLKFIRANIWMKSTRIGQLFDNVVQYLQARKRKPDLWHGLEMFLGNQVAADDPRLKSVYDNFRRNTIDLCDVGRRAGAAVILSTVAVNLRDCPPLGSQHRADLSPDELKSWESAYRAAVDLESKSRWEDALKQYEAAGKIDDRFAELQFRLGRCLAELGRPAEARDRFALARDLDVLRFRADSRINAVLRDVAAEEKARGVCAVDAEKALTESDLAVDGIPGERLFYEHVHFTFDGNYLLARAVLDQVESALPQLAASRKGDAVLSRKRCGELLGLTPWDEYQMAMQMMRMTSKPPFTNQFDHDRRQDSVQEGVKRLESEATTPGAMRKAYSDYEKALVQRPDDWTLHHRLAKLAMVLNEPVAAVEHLRIVLKYEPRESMVLCDLGDSLGSCGKTTEAMTHYRKALEIDPEFTMAHNNLANALERQGSLNEAIAHFEKALELDPKVAPVHFNFANVLMRCARSDEAIAHYQKALEIDPKATRVHFSLAQALDGCGQTDKAIAQYQELLRIDPKLPQVYHSLGQISARRGRWDEAIADYQKALDILPRLATVHNSLGDALIRQGRLDEAIDHFSKAVEIDPRFVSARQNLDRAKADQAARPKSK
jgi:tetratricopeptide (TPR) repeat protein